MSAGLEINGKIKHPGRHEKVICAIYTGGGGGIRWRYVMW